MFHKNYRSYIKSEISKEKEAELKTESNIVYEELCRWIELRKITIEKKMFKAVLLVCNNLRSMPKDSINAETIEMKCLEVYETEHNKNILEYNSQKHLGTIEGYVKEVFPLMQIRLDAESRYSREASRIRQIDLLDLIILFDTILKKIKDETLRTKIEILMNKFVREDLYSKNEYL